MTKPSNDKSIKGFLGALENEGLCYTVHSTHLRSLDLNSHIWCFKVSAQPIKCPVTQPYFHKVYS